MVVGRGAVVLMRGASKLTLSQIVSSSAEGDTKSSEEAVTPFALLSTQRSGTSWFMDRLTKHPEVGGYGEVLLPGVKGRPTWPPGAEDRPFLAVYLRDRGMSHPRLWGHYYLFRYLDYLYQPRRELRAIGFKLMYDQVLRYPGILVYLRARKVRIIHLVRTNLLDVVLSREAMALRRHPHGSSGGKGEDVRVEIDTARLLGELKRLEREQQIARLTCRALRLDTHDVTYESLLGENEPIRGTLGFLGIDHDRGVDFTSSLRKLARKSHRESIVNFDEVEACLSPTEFGRFI